MPKFQHLLNDRQKRQQYPVKLRFPVRLRGRRSAGANSEEESTPEAMLRERPVLAGGAQTTFGLFTVRSRLVES